MHKSIMAAIEKQPTDWTEEEKQFILSNPSLLDSLLELLNNTNALSSNCWTPANRKFLEHNQPDEEVRYFFHPLSGEFLPVIHCPISLESAKLYQEVLGISSEESLEMVRIQNVDPDERNLSDWQFLEAMNERALKLN